MLTRGTRTLLATGAAAAVLAGAVPSALAAEGGAPQQVTFAGEAWGHGHGLSQYGAKARGEAGDGYREILGFYYPGTTVDSATGRIRVLVTGDTSRDVVVEDRKGLRVTALGNGRTWTPRQQARLWRITPGERGRSVISYKTGRWREWRTVPGDAELSARGGALRLRTPAGPVDYRGALRSATPANGGSERDTVNVVPLDAYVKGVVPDEMPAQWDADAVRAQAVAARTYAAYERAAVPAGRHFDVWDTTRSQVYGGRTAEEPESNAAVRATAREVLSFEGGLAFTQFARSNGGWTSQGWVHGEDAAYLPAREDRFDRKDDSWTATFDADEITDLWPGMGDLESITLERDVNEKWVDRVTVQGSAFSRSVSGETFASWLGLRSHFFDDPVLS
ncbi:SpoIID/LytB domain-containing protein [Nocardioides sp. GCM10027113]|uniref:SpoIID/LytB domain-containing protein n=1 Tax=unclassified Nocardioides TaxID=2615069 RepID=UPI00360CFDC4